MVIFWCFESIGLRVIVCVPCGMWCDDVVLVLTMLLLMWLLLLFVCIVMIVFMGNFWVGMIMGRLHLCGCCGGCCCVIMGMALWDVVGALIDIRID